MNTDPQLVVKVEQLVKKYKGSEKPSVDHLDLVIEKGEIFGLLGPNGAGKTTTLSLITGLLNPNSGTVELMGKKLAKRKKKALKHVGLVPQEIALYPTLTADENLMFFARMYGLSDYESKAKINNFLEVTGLQHVRNKRVDKYSGGMKRRINLLAAILHDPSLLILDEPTVGIDVQSKNAIIQFLKKLNDEGMTILYTSHHLDEAEDFCSNITILDEGKVIAANEPKKMIENHAGANNLEDVFLSLTGKKLRD